LNPEAEAMPIGAIVHRLETVLSTNDAARALALGGAVHGTAVLAREQTRGRGTKGRAWHSPAGLGLYASFILRGRAGAALPFPHLLPLAAGLAASDAVFEASDVECGLKWPNDIVYCGKKLGGILCEGVSGGAGGDFAIVGVGLNVGHDPIDFPDGIREASTSIQIAGGRAVTVETLWAALCGALDRWYNVLARGDKEKVVRTFESRPAFPRGAAVRIETAAETFEAEYRGLDGEGRLVVTRSGAGTTVLDAVLKLDRLS
jgi:BirA family transcriptional regulator, biotin operon repressor / biotin---[acetyl-CoA-carboxylase] ligase